MNIYSRRIQEIAQNKQGINKLRYETNRLGFSLK